TGWTGPCGNDKIEALFSVAAKGLQRKRCDWRWKGRQAQQRGKKNAKVKMLSSFLRRMPQGFCAMNVDSERTPLEWFREAARVYVEGHQACIWCGGRHRV